MNGNYPEDYNYVRSISSNLSGKQDYESYYENNQQCWASFKCPSGTLAYWRLKSFHTEDYYDQVLFYGVNNYQARIYSGELGSSSTYETLWDNEITFEFKSDESVTEIGFEILLMCK